MSTHVVQWFNGITTVTTQPMTLSQARRWIGQRNAHGSASIVAVERGVITEVIHWSDWASQPDIRIACDQTYTTPAWHTKEDPRGSTTGTPGVYRGDDGRLYTFEHEPTCPGCLAVRRG